MAENFKDFLNFSDNCVYPLVKRKDHGDIDLLLIHKNTAIVVEYKTRTNFTDMKNEVVQFYGRREEYETVIKNSKYLKNKIPQLDSISEFKFLFIPYRFTLKNTHILKEKLISLKYKSLNLNDGNNFKANFNILNIKTLKSLFFDLGKEVESEYAKRELLKNLYIQPVEDNKIIVPAIESSYYNINKISNYEEKAKKYKLTEEEQLDYEELMQKPNYKLYNFSCSI